MVIDHIGKILFANELLFQVVGRICFPIFAYCLVVGFIYTQSTGNYFKRLLTFAIISQPFYSMAFGYSLFEPNILFTLLLGLASLHFLRERKWVLYVLVFVCAFIIRSDYGLTGLLLINLFYIFHASKAWAMVLSAVLIILTFPFNLNIVIQKLLTGADKPFARTYSLNLFQLVALPLLFFPIGYKIKIPRPFFYYFYPGHLALLAIIKWLLTN